MQTHVGDVRRELREGSRNWAATMAATSLPGASFATAHAGAAAAVGTMPRRDRAWREAWEAANLAPGATQAAGAGRRLRPEAPDADRTCFERDRDRILHSSAFRRLAGKTQVVIFPDDHQRTRLTHALEVAQIAVAIARAVGLNEALTEAIALGHDCGHGPGGHASEIAFSAFLPLPYDHAVWGADVALAPLNLCAETLDGIRNHSWSRPSPSTPEGAVVSWADRIAYVCHDFEDAVHAGIIGIAEHPTLAMASGKMSRSAQIDGFVRALTTGIVSTGTVAMPHEAAAELAACRLFNHEHIYLRPASVAQAEVVIQVLRALVEHLIEHPAHVPAKYRTPAPGATETTTAEGVVAWVSGMTDRYAFMMAESLLGWNPSGLPDGIDVHRR